MIFDLFLASLSLLVVWLFCSAAADVLHRRRSRRVWWTDDPEPWK